MANPTILNNCLASLRSSTDLLASSISILNSGTSDLTRLSKVLAQTRHFELLPSATLHAAQSTVLSELTPEIESLIARVESQVEKLERREQGLRAKWELQEGRLGRESDSGAFAGRRPSADARRPSIGAAERGRAKPDARQELKAKQLQAKKQRLSYAVERLTLQAQQTERKLRQSMAAQEMRLARDSLGGEEVDESDF